MNAKYVEETNVVHVAETHLGPHRELEGWYVAAALNSVVYLLKLGIQCKVQPLYEKLEPVAVGELELDPNTFHIKGLERAIARVVRETKERHLGVFFGKDAWRTINEKFLTAFNKAVSPSWSAPTGNTLGRYRYSDRAGIFLEIPTLPDDRLKPEEIFVATLRVKL